jgi:hypothetical protein
MSHQLAIIIDGVWMQPQDQHRAIVNPPTREIEIDRIVSLLSQVVLRAQSLSPEDQRRVRDLTHAASAMLMATTYLPKNDQRIFETALRDIASKGD